MEPTSNRALNGGGRRECTNRRDHYVNLLVNGHCHKCLRAFSLPENDEKAFDRLNAIKAKEITN